MIVLDAHAWIGFVDSSQPLGQQAAAAIEKARHCGEGPHTS